MLLPFWEALCRQHISRLHSKQHQNRGRLARWQVRAQTSCPDWPSGLSLQISGGLARAAHHPMLHTPGVNPLHRQAALQVRKARYVCVTNSTLRSLLKDKGSHHSQVRHRLVRKVSGCAFVYCLLQKKACTPMSSWLQRRCFSGSSQSACHSLHTCCYLQKSTAGVMNHQPIMYCCCIGDGEDVGRHDTLGAGSDSMSNVVGTAASLMQPARHQPQHALCLLPSQAQPRAQGLSSGHLASRPLHTLQNRPPAEPESADGLKEKRKTIALDPGPIANSHNGRKRKRPPPKGTDPSQQQQQQQQQQGPDALQGPDKAVMRLEPCGLLNGLLQQVLHFLRQSCHVPFPGPFQTEVCCLSATAAALCRLTGKSAVSQ